MKEIGKTIWNVVEEERKRVAERCDTELDHCKSACGWFGGDCKTQCVNNYRRCNE